MSSCYKCGKELPGAETECSPSCNELEERLVDYETPTVEEAAASGELLGLSFEIRFNEKTIRKNHAAFIKAAGKFKTIMARALVESGLSEFQK